MPEPSPSLQNIVRQASEEGVSRETLYHLIEKATEEGAARALADLGLQDRNAQGDLNELRALLDSWRETRRTVRQIILKWVIKIVLTSLILGLAVKMKLLHLGSPL
ncbi:DUF6127 family protein [Emcibacter nanhaiensis]|uniref:Uncharacterized protein n=1 Tax=Emcibacter nanhaiensis TaxID=1505037 RepID=A0A501PCX2_9PROT|nr:DUF6127 family protein [Emcibacter nanhaiensis]TPD57754.1 hypothetical protein FIV46_16765 [Emcibacter nanhaiensis]